MMFDNSRYLHTPVYTRNGNETPLLKIRERFSFSTENCTVHEWTEGDTLDGVSVRYYESPDFGWAILDANVKYRTEFDIEYGDKILIPDIDEILDIVNT